jgi:peptidoglycan/LPS O-acetylase OafA/YrhL
MAWFPKTALGTEKYPALTGIRALGAIAVFFDHFPAWPDSHIVINVLAFFYALSGFLIVRVYYERAELTRPWLAKYFANRFARIYPVYFLLLSVAVCLHHDFSPWVLLANYTLLHALFYHTDIIIQPSWSLTVEECFYFLAPAFMVLAKRYNFLAAFALGSLLLLAALIISELGIVFLQTPMFVLSTTFFGHFVEFFAGVYLALAVMKLEKTGPIAAPGAKYTLTGLAGVAVLLVAMLGLYQHPPAKHFPVLIVLLNNFLIPLPIALLYWGLIRENTVLSRLLSHNLAGLLGRSSYSFYLLHKLTIDYIGIPLSSSVPGYRPAFVLLTFIISWITAVLLFIFYEEPLNVFIRRKFRSQGRSVGMQATLFQVNQ